jgi:hypothetical protein
MKIRKVISISSIFIFLSATSVSADTVNYSDTTKPIIESITLNPLIVNVSTEGAVLIATIVASDDLNNMVSFEGHLVPLFGANPQTRTDKALSTKVVDGRVQVTFQLKYVFKKGTPVGEYQIRATVYDAADNRLIGAGTNMPGNSFKVINDMASGPIDVTQFDYSVKLQEYSEQIKVMTSDLVISRTKISQLEKQLETLNSNLNTVKAENGATQSKENSQIASLQVRFNSLEKKIKTICSKKPKPKGC